MAEELIEEKDEREDDPAAQGETVELAEESSEVEDTPDGGAIIREKTPDDSKLQREHFANIVDEVDQSDLAFAVTDLLDKIEKDKEARKKRDKQYEEGLRRTGLGDDAPGGAQFSGATKVVHPLLSEACVDFSARVMKEIFPPSGPVKTKLHGERDKSKVAKAERKAAFMNWQTTERMPEFRSELEQLTTQMPLGGAQYLKLMWNPQWNRPCAEFISVDDVYLPFAATNFYSAERKTHVQYITKLEYEKRVKSGMYRDVDLGAPSEPEFSGASKANDKIEGREQSAYNEDGLRMIFEIYTFLDFGDGVEPYIISIDFSSRMALSLYRNWEPDDETRQELDWIVEFGFIPWRGAYPIGLTHLIGGLSGAATGALRALLDSAHIQNIPTLLKLKGGANGQTINLQPTEIAEIEGGAMVDDIRKLAMAMPFNPPSPVLFQLLGFLVDAGKGVVQTSFEKLSDQNPNAPVGTTLALIEQGMVVFSSIHSRIHNSVTRVFKILHRINSAYQSHESLSAEAKAAGLEIKPEDFDGPMDVVPVSDPAVFSETQRFAQTQAILQRAQLLPQLYDARKVEEMFLRSLKVPDEDVLQPKPGSEDRDPVSENVAAAMGQPVFVLPRQDHINHIKVHLDFFKSPLFGQNPAIVKTYAYPMAQHLRDHLLNLYLTEAHGGVDRAQHHEVISADDAAAQAQVILQVQHQLEKTLGQFGQELAQIDQFAQQFKPQPPMPPDNTMQVAQLNAQVQGKALEQRSQTDQATLALRQQELQQKEQREEREFQLQAQEHQAEAADKERERQEAARLEAERQMAETQRTQMDNATRESTNTADNMTAIKLAEMEIDSGERIAVSTGTGLNPGPG